MALLEYECPCCGGTLKYDPSISKVKCEFCDSELDMEQLAALDAELANEAPEDLSWNNEQTQMFEDIPSGMSVYSCSSCGAQIITDSTTAATKCPFCDNPIVMMNNLKGVLKPDLVVPFKLDKKAAKAKYEEHLLGKKLLPRVFRDQNHIDEIKGVYVPFWIFDSSADADMSFKGAKLNVYTAGGYRVTESRYYRILRSGDLKFANITIDASEKMADDLMDSVEPFDLSTAVDFQTAYLAGYLADKYDVAVEKCSERANLRVKNSTAAAFRNTVTGYTSVTTESSNIRLHEGRVRYGLLPIWLLNTTWNGMKYTFAMNGQTGKFVGNLPCDKSLFNKMWFSTSAIVAAVTLGLSYLIWMLL